MDNIEERLSEKIFWKISCSIVKRFGKSEENFDMENFTIQPTFLMAFSEEKYLFTIQITEENFLMDIFRRK